MSLQMLQKLTSTNRLDDDSLEVAKGDADMEASKENRVVNLHLPSSASPSKSVRPKQRTPQKRVTSDHALQAARRMREQDNALSAKIIQNLQSDKVALASKMEELNNSMATTKQRCVALENSVAALATANEQLETANQSLQEEAEHQANTISELQAQLLKERAARPAVETSAADMELLQLAKSYLKQKLMLKKEKGNQIKPVDKSSWQSDSLVAQCNGCNQKFGTFLRRHHCRGCGKLFCAACCQNNLHLLSDSAGTAVLGVTDGKAQLSASDDSKSSSGPRQRSCKVCFKQAENTEARTQHLQEQSKVGLRAMEDWLVQSEINLEELLADEC